MYLGDLAKAVRNRTDLHFGLYHSLFEWFNPVYIADAQSHFTSRRFVEVRRIYCIVSMLIITNMILLYMYIIYLL